MLLRNKLSRFHPLRALEIVLGAWVSNECSVIMRHNCIMASPSETDWAKQGHPAQEKTIVGLSCILNGSLCMSEWLFWGCRLRRGKEKIRFLEAWKRDHSCLSLPWSPCLVGFSFLIPLQTSDCISPSSVSAISLVLAIPISCWFLSKSSSLCLAQDCQVHLSEWSRWLYHSPAQMPAVCFLFFFF